jgi:hypothetical protein
LPPYAEPLTEKAKSGLVVATEVVDPVAPPPSSDADNLGGERMTTKVVASQVATEPLVEATARGGDAVEASNEQIVPRHLQFTTRKHR